MDLSKKVETMHFYHIITIHFPRPFTDNLLGHMLRLLTMSDTPQNFSQTNKPANYQPTT